MSLHRKLNALVGIVLDEAGRNPVFDEKLGELFGEASPAKQPSGKRTGRRTPAVLDPVAIMQEKGETSLREALRKLDLDQLRDIVAEYGMDPAKLAMKWKAADRVIDLIVSTAALRLTKGDAFREDGKGNEVVLGDATGSGPG